MMLLMLSGLNLAGKGIPVPSRLKRRSENPDIPPPDLAYAEE